jgi:hypothetical protein
MLGKLREGDAFSLPDEAVFIATSLSSQSPFPRGIRIEGRGARAPLVLVGRGFVFQGEVQGLHFDEVALAFYVTTPVVARTGPVSICIHRSRLTIDGISRHDAGPDLVDNGDLCLLHVVESTLEVSTSVRDRIPGHPFPPSPLEGEGVGFLRGRGPLLARFEDCEIVGTLEVVGEHRPLDSRIVFSRCTFRNPSSAFVKMAVPSFVRLLDCKFQGVGVEK